MNGIDTSKNTAPDEGGLGPREAATLLDQTRRQARQRFEARPPLLMLIAALAVLSPTDRSARAARSPTPSTWRWRRC